MTTEGIKFVKPFNSDEPIPYDDTKGNQYKDFWTFNSRVATSFEITSTGQGLRKGAIKFKNPIVKGKTVVQLYYLEYEGEGDDMKAALFQKLEDLAKFINNGTVPKIQAINGEVYFEFDATMKWDDSGVHRIGYFYEINNGWNYVKNQTDTVHIELDPSIHKDIEFWIRSKGSTNKLAYARYRRDIPLTNHVDFYQYTFINKSTISMHQSTDNQIILTKTSGSDDLGDIYWRYTDSYK